MGVKIVILFYFIKFAKKQLSALKLEEPGFLKNRKYSWLGASLGGTRECSRWKLSCSSGNQMPLQSSMGTEDLNHKTAFPLQVKKTRTTK